MISCEGCIAVGRWRTEGTQYQERQRPSESRGNFERKRGGRGGGYRQ